MPQRLTQGDDAPAVQAKNIHSQDVSVPDSSGGVVHLQFRRYSGCPICNLRLQSFVRRSQELSSAGVKEMVVFHSSDKALLPYQGSFPFDVVGDPKKALYKNYGVRASLLSLLSPGAWPAIGKASVAKDNPKRTYPPRGGVLGLPADFLIAPDGKLIAAHYGKHADDQWSVDEVLEAVRQSGFGTASAPRPNPG